MADATTGLAGIGEPGLCCYCICTNNPNTQLSYIGYTIKFSKRLRQHNSVIKGGAKYTTRCGHIWEPFFVVTGFPARKKAMQFEWHLKRRSGQYGQQTLVEFSGCKRRKLAALVRTLALPKFADIVQLIHITFFGLSDQQAAAVLNLPPFRCLTAPASQTAVHCSVHTPADPEAKCVPGSASMPSPDAVAVSSQDVDQA